MKTFEFIAVGVAILLFIGLFFLIGLITLYLVCDKCPYKNICDNNKDNEFVPPCHKSMEVNNQKFGN